MIEDDRQVSLKNKQEGIEMVKCYMCGESESTNTIMNPNDFREEGTWEVCKDCKDFIKSGQKMAFGEVLRNMHKNDKFTQEYGNKLVKEAKKEMGFEK